MPVKFGITTSVSNRSGEADSAAWSASKGSTNDRASNPLLIKINSKVDAMILSSSTTNTIERLG
jgi:hypothetical protein